MAIRRPPRGDAQLELFSALFTDISPRDAREAMEVPFLSITKRPRFEPIRFKKGDVEVVVTGGKPYGIANIWDWDLILWLLSQIRHALDRGETPSRKVRFHRRAFLKDTRRGVGGDQYRRLEQAIERLSNTNVFTTIRPEEGDKTIKFSWIEYVELERDKRGVVANIIVVLPEWLYSAICDSSRVLSLHRDYFLLTGGIERFIYRLVRKGAGRSEWAWKMSTLYERSGTTQKFKYFARSVRKIVSDEVLLGYRLSLENRGGEVCLRAIRECQRGEENGRDAGRRVVGEHQEKPTYLRLETSTYEKAKRLAPGLDVYALEADWRRRTEQTGAIIRNPDAAFLGWCRSVNEKAPARTR